MIRPTRQDIKDLRKRHNLTQEKLADSLYGIKLETLRSWEKGQRNCPSIVCRAALAAVSSANATGADPITMSTTRQRRCIVFMTSSIVVDGRNPAVIGRYARKASAVSSCAQ